MSRTYLDNNKDVDSEAQRARRKNFIARMDRKLEYKMSIADSEDELDRI
jgi:hypothetical protein